MDGVFTLGLLGLVWFGVPLWTIANNSRRSAEALEKMARIAKGRS